MGAVLTIARRDILGYLSAPKAATVFWVFLMIMGLFFYSFVNTFVQIQQQAMMRGGGQVPGLEQLVRALFQNSHFVLLLIIPAVSMGSFAEEKKNHSFKLLQTAPISTWQIVLGKYFALVGVMGLVLAGSAVYPAFVVTYGNPDIGPILSSYLGMFLLMSAQLAFGLWISSMTKNQITSFLFTIFGLFLLLILDFVAPSITGGGVSEATVKYLASTTHLDSFFKGLITVADVTYFLVFAGVFLFLANNVIDSQRWR